MSINDEAWLQAVTKLIADGLEEVERKYGTHGKHPLSYHNTQHAQDVMDAAEAIGEHAAIASKISEHDVWLAKVAACYHDVDHESPNAEEVSASVVASKMRHAKIFSAEDISKVRAMILATAVHIVEGKLKQAATSDYLMQLMADADLASLGRPTEVYWNRAQALLKERNHENEPDEKMQKAYRDEQEFLLSYYCPLTDEAAVAFPHLQANLQFIKGLQN